MKIYLVNPLSDTGNASFSTLSAFLHKENAEKDIKERVKVDLEEIEKSYIDYLEYEKRDPQRFSCSLHSKERWIRIHRPLARDDFDIEEVEVSDAPGADIQEVVEQYKDFLRIEDEGPTEIVKICGCTTWEYQGQVIRDVNLLKEALWDCITRLENCGSAEDKEAGTSYKKTFGEIFLKDL